MYGRAMRSAAARLPGRSRADGIELSDDARQICPYCGKRLGSELGCRRHVMFQPHCRAKHLYAISVEGRRSQKGKQKSQANHTPPESAGSEPPTKRARTDDNAPPVAGPPRLPFPDPDPSCSMREGPNTGDGGGRTENGLFVEPFPIETAGAPIGTRRREEGNVQEYLESCGTLGDPNLFETAEILMTTGLTGQARTRHLQGPIYRKEKARGKGKEGDIWNNNNALLKDIDKLPTGPTWRTAEVSVGEGLDRRTHTVYLRDILEVIRELIGARRFKSWMRYAPERHWTSRDRKCRVYDEMWSGDWWWRMQYRIRNKNGTVVPLIVVTDETTMANNPRGEKAHPVYLSIGNISKAIRRKPTKRSMIIIGYLPVDQFQGIEKETRRRYRGELLHQSLGKIFEPLKTASEDGILAWCADGHLRHIYPIIAAWIADWPEQNDIAGTTQGGCPKCMQKWKGRGQGGPSAPLRNQDETLEALRAYQQTKRPAKLKKLRLRGVLPFWADIPHVDIGASLVPDLLHQLYKGMFEHVRDWVEDLLGTDEFNRRFKAMPSAQDLRHFKKGVTTVKVWAGRESRDMMRQFLPVIIDAQAPPEFIELVRALLDFSYLAHGAQLTEVELAEMDRALVAFHKAKYVLVKKDMVVGVNSFDRIAKLHMLGHYTHDIRELGTPDGYSTETPEHLHIIYVKIPWRMSNRRNAMPQIVDYVRRLEALEIQRTLIDEYYGESSGVDIQETDMYGDDEDDDESEGDEGTISGDEDTIGDEEDGVEVVSAKSVKSAIYYPRPKISIARRPTVPRVPGRRMISSYGASDFIRALRRFLFSKTHLRRSEELIVLPSDRFHVWHKAVLDHTTLSFAPSQPAHRDVIRAHPATRDTAGRVLEAGVFDTALFATDHVGFGLNRYRAGRVRAIFSLPPRLQPLHPGPLVYLDVFTPFLPDPTAVHRLYRTTPAYSHTVYPSLVLPLSCVVMACHLAPDFSSPPMPVRHSNSSGTTVTGQPFFFNDFYNYFTFLLMAYWRRIDPG